MRIGGARGTVFVLVDLPSSWKRLLADELRAVYFAELQAFVDAERSRGPVFPAEPDVFNAFRMTRPKNVRVVLLGQDPYHDDGQAHGLCFSVRPGIKPPPSLKNILRELDDDLGCPPADHGCLESWARQGVLMTNVVLTVRAHEPHSHRGRGWERFTEAVIRSVNAKRRGIVFALWGRPAQQTRRLIDTDRHAIVEAAHPSPLSAARGFFGSRPFSRINRALQQLGHDEIDWCLRSS